MCSPYLLNCAPMHYPLLIDSAVERLHGSEEQDVHLSQDALQYLYRYGDTHRDKLSKVLGKEDQTALDALSEALHKRLRAALRKSKTKDAKGRLYNPARIDKEALEKALPMSKPLT